MEIVHISFVAIISILILLFGIRVLLSNTKNKINRAFAFFAFFTAFWIVIDFTLYQSSLTDFQTFLNRLDLSAICLTVLFLSYFVTLFPKELFKIPTLISIIISILVAALIIVILFTNKIVDYAFMQDYGSNFNQGTLFYLFAIISSVIALYSVVLLVVKYFKFTNDDKQQVKYILYGIALMVIINITFNLLIPMVTKSFVYGRLGTYSAVFLVGFTAYAILKTHLFNMKVIVTEVAVVIINVILAVQIFTSQTLMEGLLRALFLLIVIYGSSILLASVRREIKFRQELQTLTDQLAKANAHLKELDAMKTEFVSLASHELLTPVSAIEGYLSMILDEHLAKVEDPKAAQYLDRIYRSSRRLARLIADMLNISRIEEGRLMVEKKDVNLNELINQTIEELKFKAEERKQKVEFNLKPNALRQTSNIKPFMTYADPDKIKEVIVNIISNSIKYSKNPGTISVSIEKAPTEKVQEIWAKIEDQVKDQPLDDQEAIKASVNEYYRQFVGKEQLLIIVKDQGIGIPKEELTKLFKKFHRVGDYSTEESQGTGLGLYISRSLVELHHGRIWADSEGRGKGSTFTFSLPDISDKEALLEMEKQVPNQKEQLKPLAKPMNEKVGEDI